MLLQYTGYVIVILLGMLSFSASATVQVEGLEIQPYPDDPNRVLVHVDALLEDVPSQIDRRLGGRIGDSCSRRIFWNGDTSIRRGGQHLELTSKVRYEEWLCLHYKTKDFETRIFWSTHPVEWRLDVNERVRVDNLVVTATVTDIRIFPDILEEWFGLRTEKILSTPIPAECGRCACYELVDELLPMAEHFEFQLRNNARDVLVKATFSVPRNLSSVLRCFWAPALEANRTLQ